MSVQNLFFARPAPKRPSPPLFSITGCEKRHPDVFPAPFFAIFHTSHLLSLPESEIRVVKLLVDPGHPQEELVGGRPPHCYIKARCRRPRIDRALQKNTHTADNHAKKPFSSYVALRICFLTHLVHSFSVIIHIYVASHLCTFTLYLL
jgi:hypothetical protein